MEERDRMDAHAELPATPGASRGGDGGRPTLVRDPLSQLEAQLGKADRERQGNTQLYEEAQGLLEEAWSLFTMCLVMRDGLLEACEEVERTMDRVQLQLGALPVAIEPDRHELLANGQEIAASDSNGVPAH